MSRIVDDWLLGIIILAFLGFIITLLILFPPIREGSVVGTRLVPAHWDYDTGTTCFSYDKDMNCTYRADNPPRWVPDTCYVRLYDEKQDREGDVRIPCETMGDYRIKQYVRFG